MTVFTNFFGGAFFGGGFFGAGSDAAGHGTGEGDDGVYAEPRRVFIDGRPYTVRSKAEYLGLLARSRRDKSRIEAEEAIERSQDAAREAVLARQATQTAETASLLHAMLAREESKRKPIAPASKMVLGEDAIPMEILMLIAPEL